MVIVYIFFLVCFLFFEELLKLTNKGILYCFKNGLPLYYKYKERSLFSYNIIDDSIIFTSNYKTYFIDTSVSRMVEL